MKSASRVFILIVLLFAALACYFIGIPAGGVFFLVLGFIFEGLFWFGLFGKKGKKATAPDNE